MSTTEIRVRLVRTRDGQSLDIPPGFELPVDEAVLRADRGRLVLEPIRPASLLRVLDLLEDLDESWPEIEDAPADPIRL